jgi:hypothetical protein
MLSGMDHAIRGTAPARAARPPQPRLPAALTTALVIAVQIALLLLLVALRLLPAQPPLERAWPLMDDGAWALAASAGWLLLLALGPLAAAALVMWQQRGRLHVRPRTAVAVAALLLATTAVTLAYRPANPLATVAARPGDGSRSIAFRLRVEGPLSTRIRSITAPDALGRLDVRLRDPRQLGGRLEPGAIVAGTATVPLAWCDKPFHVGFWATVLHVRVETPIGVRTQLLRLEPGAETGCAGRI